MVTLKVVRLGCPARLRIVKPRDAFRVLQPLARGLDREYFWRLDLDSRRRLLGCELVAVGTLDAVLIHPREVFKGALLGNAHHVIVAHNHPSQDLRPTKADRFLTDRLCAVGLLMGIEVFDHLVLCDDRFFSLRRAGMIRL